MEVAGTIVSIDQPINGKRDWKLVSIAFGDAHTVQCPVPRGAELTYHVHLPHGGQICMPPSPQDWLILLRNGLKAAFVIAREGVYKFWWEETISEVIGKMNASQVSDWIDRIEALEQELNQVHMGELGIVGYKKAVSKYGMCMEFRSLSS